MGIFVDAGVDGYLYNRARTCRAGIKGTGKAFNMAYMLNKNRIVAEKEQCYNTKSKDRCLLHTSIAGGAKETMQNILVVEDDRELNEALCYALKKQDYHTSTAFSIQEAKENISHSPGKKNCSL